MTRAPLHNEVALLALTIIAWFLFKSPATQTEVSSAGFEPGTAGGS